MKWNGMVSSSKHKICKTNYSISKIFIPCLERLSLSLKMIHNLLTIIVYKKSLSYRNSQTKFCVNVKFLTSINKLIELMSFFRGSISHIKG